MESKKTRENLEDFYNKCINCGICKSVCPVYLAIRNEVYSPRGRMILIKEFAEENEEDKISFALLEGLSACTLCSACDKVCPVEIPLHDIFLEFRKKLFEKNVVGENTKLMVENVRKKDNPFSEKEDGKFYCC